MQTTISYNIPDEALDNILGMLGYSDEMGMQKEVFMNEAIKSVVIPAIADKFINIKHAEASKMIANIPHEIRGTVEKMISITTV